MPRILVVDDIKANIALLKGILRKQNYEVVAASDGQSALNIISENPPDAVLLDIMMPGMDGMEVLDRIVNNDKTSYIPVIIVSAKDDDSSLETALDKGAIDFVKKPINNTELMARLRTALRIKNQEELKEARDAAEVSSRAKTHFLNLMSHELRTPLNAIIGFASILGMKEDSSEKKDKLENIISSGYRLLNLIETILDFSNIYSGNINIHKISFSIKELLKHIHKNYIGLARDKGIMFDLNFDSSIPDMLNGDERLIKHILTVLLDNAFRFTDKGGIDIKSDYNDGIIKIIVSDTGIGIHDNYKESVFSSFKNEKNSSSLNDNSPGLGLSICKDIIEIMGGKIYLDGGQGTGSTFTVEVPMEQ